MFFSFIVSFFLGSLLLGSSSNRQPLLFSSPVFDRLQLEEIQSLSPKNEWETSLITYFEAEALFVDGKIHESESKRQKILEKCSGTQAKELTAKEKALCLMTVLGFYQSVESKNIVLKTTQIENWLKSLTDSSFTFEDRAYVEMRTLWKLPDWFGADRSRGFQTKSLLASESLIRLHPQMASLHFFKSRILNAVGEKKRAEIALKQALQINSTDRRSRFFMDSGVPTSSLKWGIVANPAGGVGLSLGKLDERFLDTNRTLQVVLSAQSRSVYHGFLKFNDRESFENVDIQGDLDIAHEQEQYFGLGSKTELEEMVEIRQMRSQGKVGAKVPINSFNVSPSVGWFYREPLELTSHPYLRDRQLSLIPEVEVGWGRNSQSEVKVNVFGSSASFLSTHSFWGYQVKGKKSWALNNYWILSVAAQVRQVSNSSPVGTLSDLRRNLELPGVRSGRLRDFFAGSVSSSLAVQLAERWRVGSFGSLAWLGNDLNDGFNQKTLNGGGVFLENGLSPFYSRLELGYFNRELVIQAGARWAFE